VALGSLCRSRDAAPEVCGFKKLEDWVGVDEQEDPMDIDRWE
jgi:hypothetical protein